MKGLCVYLNEDPENLVRDLPGGFNSAGQGRPHSAGGSPRGTSPRRWLASAGRVSSAVVRRDWLWVGLEMLGGEGGSGRELYSALLPGPCRFPGTWT
uniref:Uncharacterized protein n=1 Tax=Larimichthys crocea TaxID=215358 RepID=A0A0F8AI60_LARCR